jgi:hypothetical protein
VETSHYIHKSVFMESVGHSTGHDCSLGWIVEALNCLWLGKVGVRAAGTTTVEYFHSIGQRRLETVPDSEVHITNRLASGKLRRVATADRRWRMGLFGRNVDDEF